MAKRFKWVVEFEVDETWVEDGFDLTDERALDIIRDALPYAYEFEVGAKVLSAPPADEVAHAMGYESAEQMKQAG